MRCVILSFLVGILILVPLSTGSAQTRSSAQLTPPVLDDFPLISTYLGAYDDSGNFVGGLSPADVTLLEDGRTIPSQIVKEISPGVQVIVAINAGPAMAIRNTQGVSRYDLISQALQAWISAQPADGKNEYSLLVNGGPQALHISTPELWLNGFSAYQPDFRGASLGLESLTLAVDLTGDPTPRPAMKRALLYITPGLDSGLLSGLPSLAARAIQNGLRIYVWMISQPGIDPTSEDQLNRLAVQTGGQFFIYSGLEPIPDLNNYLVPLERAYLLSYSSAIRSGGTHHLAARIKKGNLSLTSAEQAFPLDVQPPNPIFVSPPARIIRTAPKDSKKPLDELSPNQEELHVLIEFPDHIQRPLVSTRLYVDGRLVAENTKAPFDRFVWDLSPYIANARPMLQVEALDTLGLDRTTLELPIEIVVQIPHRDFTTLLTQRSDLVTAGAVMLAGVILVLVLVLGSRRARGAALPGRRAARDPLNQAVPLRSEPRTAPPAKPKNDRFAWPRRQAAPKSAVCLVRLDADLKAMTGSTLPLTGMEITLGRDPSRSTLVLDDPSVSALHARMRHEANGSYILLDQGSIAGTWVNFEPVPLHGQALEEGDIIHLGRVCLRFVTGKPAQRKITVAPHKETV